MMTRIVGAVELAAFSAPPERAQRARLYAVDVIVDDDQPEPVRVLGPDGG